MTDEREEERMRHSRHFGLHGFIDSFVACPLRAMFPGGDEKRVAALVGAIGRLLASMRREPLHPRVVEEALGISAQERVRWTKAGRLRRAGSGTLSSGWQLVRFPLYSPRQILELTHNSSIIGRWRSGDTTGPH
jgi:hypothetical protein